MANCRKHNLNKYNPKKLATVGMEVLSNGSIVTNNWVVDNRQKKSKKKSSEKK